MSTLTEVLDLSTEEYNAYLTAEAQAALGLSVAGFMTEYASGRLDEADPEVARIAALLGMGQNGH
jgi:hypothetical protein